jgi:hypothetical protein
MRTTLIHARVKYHLHRHPKERPDSFPTTFTDLSGNETERQIPPEDFPIIWTIPIYEYPGILLNKNTMMLAMVLSITTTMSRYLRNYLAFLELRACNLHQVELFL